MRRSTWVPAVSAIIIFLLASVGYQFLEPSAPPAVNEADLEGVGVQTTEPNANGARSENFQIVGDSLEGQANDLGSLEGTSEGNEGEAEVQTNALVTHVADGDTFDVRLDDGTEATIRMLGVNTPETVDPRRPVQCYGNEASDFTKSKLTNARVRLDADPEADERDVYGRLLRNVTLADGTDFNAYLIAQGYANAYVNFPQNAERKKELKDLESEAKDAKKGLWGDVCN